MALHWPHTRRSVKLHNLFKWCLSFDASAGRRAHTTNAARRAWNGPSVRVENLPMRPTSVP